MGWKPENKNNFLVYNSTATTNKELIFDLNTVFNRVNDENIIFSNQVSLSIDEANKNILFSGCDKESSEIFDGAGVMIVFTKMKDLTDTDNEFTEFVLQTIINDFKRELSFHNSNKKELFIDVTDIVET